LSGDFRYYILMCFIDIVYDEFKDELFNQYVTSSYNVLPASVVGSMDTSPLLSPPQNTNLPGLPNTSSQINPTKKVLVPSSIYS